MTQREADARDEIDLVREEARKPLIFRDSVTGAEIDPRDVLYYRDSKGQVKRHTAPRLTPQEEDQLATALRQALEAGQVRYPDTANYLLQNPHQLWLMAEIQSMLSPEPNETSYDFTAELMEGLTTTTGQRAVYEHETAHEPTQQLFWNEIGSRYAQAEREFIIDALAQLSPRGANRVGAQALAWLDSGHSLDDEEDKMQMYLNILNWSMIEQESDKGQRGFWGLIDTLQETVEENVVSPLINAGIGLINGAEDAARRRDLTPGQQVAFWMGLKPGDAGDFGWWNVVSGAIDAQIEMGADPLNILAGLGAANKAVKTIPIGMQVTRQARALAAARALLPRSLAGPARIHGGRVARVAYALGAQTLDDLLENTIKSGVAQQGLDLLKQGNTARFARLFPAWKNLSEEAVRVIQESVESPEEFIQVLKSDALNEVLASGTKLDDLTKAQRESEAQLRALREGLDNPIAVSEIGEEATEEVAEKVTVRLPPRFYDDHIERDLPGGEVIKRTKSYVEVSLTRADYDELLSDAEYYVSAAGSGALEPGFGGLVSSARATIKRLKDVSFENAALREIVDDPESVVYHATNPKNVRGIQKDGLITGALAFTEDTAREWAKDNLGRTSEKPVVAVFRIDKLPPSVQKQIAEAKAAGGTHVNLIQQMPPGSVKPETIYDLRLGAEAILDVDAVKFTDLIGDQRLPRELRLQAAQDFLRLNAYNAKGGQVFILSEVPLKPKRFFSWQKALERTRGTGRVATGVRRTIARITPGRIPHEIELFNTRQGVDDIVRIAEHYGLRQDAIDELVEEFTALEIGARQDWVWDSLLRRIGRETGVPAFEHQLIQFYKPAGVRNFSAAGVDLLPDGSRIPLLSTQVTGKMPVPVEVLDQVFRRARSIGTRSKLARAIGFTGRGLGGTRSRRMGLVKTLRRQLGEEAEGLSDEQLYNLAFSLVSPNRDLDGRGIIAGQFLPRAGTAFHQLHQWFTKSMLVFRPIQWMWRVALLEEPIRAHLFNLPSLYQNPLQYMARMREAYYVANVRKWAEANVSWGQDVMATLLRGKRDDIIERIQKHGLTADVFPNGKIPKSTPKVRAAVERFVENAVYGRVRPTRLNPIKKVPWAVKNRAHNIARAEAMLKKLHLPKSFDFHEEAAEIAGRLVSGYLGEAVGSSHRHLYQWTPGMTNDEAFTHGRVWGARLAEFVEDPLARMALHRYAALLRGQEPDVTGLDVVNHSRWAVLAPDLRRKYQEADDILVAERYLDDMLAKEMDHLFRPFIDSMDNDELADLFENFAIHRQIRGTIGADDIEWDLRSANYGGGVRQVGEYTASVRHDASVNIPSNLPAPSLDGRFMAEDDRGYIRRMADWTLQTFGEKATQNISRRPAWIHTYDRWYRNYRNLDIPEHHARALAIDHANRMVNYVFFNMNEAPHYIAKMNKNLPFFGATYEVLGTWSYKMPVAVGGSWPLGAGEFARKFDRLIDGLVNIGLLDREVDEEGNSTITLNLVPPDSDSADVRELGRWLQGAGFAAVNTLEQFVATILRMEEGLELRSQGYDFAVGHPLDFKDYGILSFAQADIGLNPLTNIAVTALAARIPGAGAPRRTAVQTGETLADVAERLNVDPEILVRYNREVFVDTEGFGSSELYTGILSGNVDVSTVLMPVVALNIPGSSLWDALSDTFMPFGEINSPHEFAASFLPSTLRWVWAGMALQNQPTDEFWKDNDLDGVFGGLLPEINEAQVASQLNEAFMYLEAHDLVDGKGPFQRIQEKTARLKELELIVGKEEEANALHAELRLDIEAFLGRAQKVAAESLILRGATGSFMPSSPGHVRLEEQKIQEYWNTKEYADSILLGEGITTLRPFKSMEEVEQYKEQLAAWLTDPTAERARAVFRANHPQLMAYLTPKTFYREPVPDIDSYEEYQRQIEAGEREPSPLHVTMWRARSAAIQADYYNKFIATFGGNPLEAAANALQNRSTYEELNDERNMAYEALEMWDDMHGGVYDNWRKENYQDVESWAQDQINDKLNSVRDSLNILFELEDNLDLELDLEGIANLNSTIRGAIAEIGKAIREYNELTDRTVTRNAYEQAINRYFEEVYIPYAEHISSLYDQLPEVGDSERQSIIYEQIKLFKNQYAGTSVYLDGDTTTPFPNPLEYSWQGKSEEEHKVKLQQWVTRPVEWMDLDQSIRLLEVAPQLQGYIPSNLPDYDIYREFTLRKVQIDEMFEANEITRTQRNKAIENLEKALKLELIEQGRGREVEMMSFTPYEKLELSGLLPQNLGIFGDHVRYYKQVLEAAEQSPGTIIGRQITAPLYDMVEQAFYTDPNMRTTLQELGINLQDKSVLDSFLPWLFFGYTGER